RGDHRGPEEPAQPPPLDTRLSRRTLWTNRRSLHRAPRLLLCEEDSTTFFASEPAHRNLRVRALAPCPPVQGAGRASTGGEARHLLNSSTSRCRSTRRIGPRIQVT